MTRPVRTRPSTALPEPDRDAQAHSARVVAAVRHAIEAAGGWISFAHYMQTVLYAPGLGYYVAGARKFGAAGDFVTAPEMTPLFAQALARNPVMAIVERSDARDVSRARRRQRRARRRTCWTRSQQAVRRSRTTGSSR